VGHRVSEIRSALGLFVVVGLCLYCIPSYADTQRGIAAFDRKDYPTAFREFMESAKKGDAEAQAGVGAMHVEKINPPGTGKPLY